MKKASILIIILCLRFASFPLTARAAEPDGRYVKITPDKEYASPGDVITFTVTLGPTDHLGTLQMFIILPNGLTYVSKSGHLFDDAASALAGKNGTKNFAEPNETLDGSICILTTNTSDYSGSAPIDVAEFKCTVNAGASGRLVVSPEDLEIYSMVTYEDFTGTYEILPAVVTIGEAPVSYVVNGRDYSPVFDADYYLAKYADLRAAFGNDRQAAFRHFLNHGMAEGRQGSADFDVRFYRSYYADLERAFGGNYVSYFIHYLDFGQSEHRKAVEGGAGSSAVAPDDYNYSDDGFDAGRYELVFNADYYLANHADLQAAYGTDKAKVFKHFLTNGMSEGRQASENFNAKNYRARYADLREAFGDDLAMYYEHYISHGYKENRRGD